MRVKPLVLKCHFHRTSNPSMPVPPFHATIFSMVVLVGRVLFKIAGTHCCISRKAVGTLYHFILWMRVCMKTKNGITRRSTEIPPPPTCNMHAFNFVYVADISAAFSTSLKSYSHLMKLQIHDIISSPTMKTFTFCRVLVLHTFTTSTMHTNNRVDTFIVIACGRI